ncbi:uncharacterized protein LOC133199552 [Saccostrea echinata]|uniref:uncharacterized protein LOC133199552 n=1 Tax=Saccostrea echinata TaxID=191078 RepID=UPI002A7F10B6|nr:uncharacterized protein LOC133199552 [Saccostrea echinata]
MAASIDLLCLSSTENAFQYLAELYRDVEKKIKATEYDCFQLQLLFKPWPSNGKDSFDEKKIDMTQLNNVKSGEDPKETLTQDEREAINAMEKILVKAEKARNLQKKAEDCPESYCRKLAASTQQTELTTDERGKAKDTSSNERINSMKKDDGKMKTQKKFTTQRLTQIADTRKPVGIKRPLSSNKNSVKAPFQTNPSLSFPKKSSNQEAMIRGTRSKKFVSKGGTTLLKRAPTAGQIKSVSESLSAQNKTVKTEVKNQQDESCSVMEDKLPEDMTQEHVEKAESPPTHNKPPISQNKSSHSSHADSTSVLVKGQTAPGVKYSIPTTNTNKKDDDTVNRFLLLKDGNNIEIPGKLRKLVSVNHKLRQKLSVNRMTKKVDSRKSGQDFIDSVEQLFELDSGYEVTLTVERVEREYEELQKTLEGLTTELSDDETPAFEVLRTKNMLELVLTRFYQLQEEVSLQNTDLCHLNLPKVRPQRSPSVPRSRSAMMWSEHIDKYTLPALNYRVQYHSPRQLERYLQLVFQLQYKQLLNKLQEVVLSNITDLMETPDLSPGDYMQLLRSLCFTTDSKTYPVVVKDTMDGSVQSSD